MALQEMWPVISFLDLFSLSPAPFLPCPEDSVLPTSSGDCISPHTCGS